MRLLAVVKLILRIYYLAGGFIIRLHQEGVRGLGQKAVAEWKRLLAVVKLVLDTFCGCILRVFSLLQCIRARNTESQSAKSISLHVHVRDRVLVCAGVIVQAKAWSVHRAWSGVQSSGC